MKSKTLFATILFAVLIPCSVSAQVFEPRISRERTMAEADDPVAFAQYQRRMEVRRKSRGALTREYRRDNGSAPFSGKMLRHGNTDGRWYGWRWVGRSAGSGGNAVPGYYQAAR